MGLVFNVSSPTVCRRIQAMTKLMAGHFRMPERKVKLSEEEQADLLYLMIDGTERPVRRPKKPSAGKARKRNTPHLIKSSQMTRSVYWLLDAPIMDANMTSEFMTRRA